MYDITHTYLNTDGICNFLGIGRRTALKLCQEKPHGFPVVKIGGRYQADRELLAMWRDSWYTGKFDIKENT